MTGLLRNADVVVMSSYAPLLAKIGSTQWTPDLIWFDNTRVYGSPSYHVQAMYSRNRPDVVFPIKVEPPLYAVAGLAQKEGEIILAVANPGGEAVAAEIDLRGVVRVAPEAKSVVLTSAGPDDENTLEAPAQVAPREGMEKIAGTGTQLQLYQQAGCRVLGIDPSPAMANKARIKLGAEAGVVLGDAIRMPFASASVDLALMSLMLHELPESVRFGLFLLKASNQTMRTNTLAF